MKFNKYFGKKNCGFYQRMNVFLFLYGESHISFNQR